MYECVYMKRVKEGKSSKKIQIEVCVLDVHALFLFLCFTFLSQLPLLSVRPLLWTLPIHSFIYIVSSRSFLRHLFFYIPVVLKCVVYVYREKFEVKNKHLIPLLLSLSPSLFGRLCKLKDSWWRHTICCLSRRFYWLVRRKDHYWSLQSLSIIIIRQFNFIWNYLCYTSDRIIVVINRSR
jgi:hypothetical protein